jgi:hypothetical protein
MNTIRAFQGSAGHSEVRSRIIQRRAEGEISRGAKHAPYYVWATAFLEDYRNAEEELGIPLPIMDFGGNLFEFLHPEEAVELPLRLVDAVRPGADLNPAFFLLIHNLLVDSEVGAVRFANADEQELLSLLSKMLCSTIKKNQFQEAWQLVGSLEIGSRSHLRTWDSHIRFGINYLAHIALVTIGAHVHGGLEHLPGKPQLSFFIRKAMHWNLVLESFAQKAALYEEAVHSPELQEVGYFAYLKAAERLSEHFLQVVYTT